MNAVVQKAYPALKRLLFLFGLFVPLLAFPNSEFERVKEQIKITNAALRACEQSINDEPLVKRFRAELFPLDSAENKYTVLASSEKLSAEQKKFMLQALPVVTKCRQVRIDGEAGLPTLPITKNYYSQVDSAYGRLLRDEISIGQANFERQKAAQEANVALRKLWDSYQASQSSTGSSSSSMLLPLLMQQQLMQGAVDAADQRNRELIDAMKPRASQTDCTRDGWGNVRCTTR